MCPHAGYAAVGGGRADVVVDDGGVDIGGVVVTCFWLFCFFLIMMMMMMHWNFLRGISDLILTSTWFSGLFDCFISDTF